MKLLNKELLGTLRKGTVSFLIQYSADLAKDEAFYLYKKLGTKKFCLEENCYFYSDINYDEEKSETIIGIIVYLSLSKWPKDKYEQESIMNEYMINIQRTLDIIIKNKDF